MNVPEAALVIELHADGVERCVVCPECGCDAMAFKSIAIRKDTLLVVGHIRNCVCIWCEHGWSEVDHACDYLRTPMDPPVEVEPEYARPEYFIENGQEILRLRGLIAEFLAADVAQHDAEVAYENGYTHPTHSMKFHNDLREATRRRYAALDALREVVEESE